MVVKKTALMAFEEFANAISQEAEEKGITEKELLDDLKKVRKEIWDERNREYISSWAILTN
jgi:glycerol-3-phosphate O-acyltransferase